MILLLRIILQTHPRKNKWFKNSTIIELFVVQFQNITQNRPLTCSLSNFEYRIIDINLSFTTNFEIAIKFVLNCYNFRASCLKDVVHILSQSTSRKFLVTVSVMS